MTQAVVTYHRSHYPSWAAGNCGKFGEEPLYSHGPFQLSAQTASESPSLYNTRRSPAPWPATLCTESKFAIHLVISTLSVNYVRRPGSIRHVTPGHSCNSACLPWKGTERSFWFNNLVTID